MNKFFNLIGARQTNYTIYELAEDYLRDKRRFAELDRSRTEPVYKPSIQWFCNTNTSIFILFFLFSILNISSQYDGKIVYQCSFYYSETSTLPV